jgi:hypothetical protein
MTSASAIEEVVAALHAVIGELDDAGHARNDAAGKAGEALTGRPRSARPPPRRG